MPPPFVVTKDGLSIFWFLVACGSLLWAAWTTQGMTSGLGAPQFILLDQPSAEMRALGVEAVSADPSQLGLSTCRQSASIDFTEGSEMRAQLCELAMQTLFNRGPLGLDGEHRRPRLFVGRAADFVRQGLAVDAANWRDEQRHQKVEITKITIEPYEGEEWQSRTSGQLIRTSVVKDKIRTEVFGVEAILVWRLNLDLRFNGQFPYVCHVAAVDIIKHTSKS